MQGVSKGSYRVVGLLLIAQSAIAQTINQKAGVLQNTKLSIEPAIQYLSGTLYYNPFLSGGERWFIAFLLIHIVILFQVYILVNIFMRTRTNGIKYTSSKQPYLVQMFLQMFWVWAAHDNQIMIVFSVIAGSTMYGQAGLYNQGIQFVWTFIQSITISTLQFVGYHKNFQVVGIFQSQMTTVPLAVLTSILLPLANQALVNKQFSYIDVAISFGQIVIGLALSLIWFQVCVIAPLNTTIKECAQIRANEQIFLRNSSAKAIPKDQNERVTKNKGNHGFLQIGQVALSFLVIVILIFVQFFLTLQRPPFQMFEYNTLYKIPKNYELYNNLSQEPAQNMYNSYNQSYQTYNQSNNCGVWADNNCSQVYTQMSNILGKFTQNTNKQTDLVMDSYVTYSQSNIASPLNYSQNGYMPSRQWLMSITPDLSGSLSLAALEVGLMTGINIFKAKIPLVQDPSSNSFQMNVSAYSAASFSNIYGQSNIDSSFWSFVGHSQQHGANMIKVPYPGTNLNYIFVNQHDWLQGLLLGSRGAFTFLLQNAQAQNQFNNDTQFQFLTAVRVAFSFDGIICPKVLDLSRGFLSNIDVDASYDLKVQYLVDLYYSDTTTNGQVLFNTFDLNKEDLVGSIRGKDLLRLSKDAISAFCQESAPRLQHIYLWDAKVSTENNKRYFSFSPAARPMQRFQLFDSPQFMATHEFTYETTQCQGFLDILQDQDLLNKKAPPTPSAGGMLNWANQNITEAQNYVHKAGQDCNITYQFNMHGKIGISSQQINTKALLYLNVILTIVAALTMALSYVFSRSKISWIGSSTYNQALRQQESFEPELNAQLPQNLYNNYVWFKRATT